MTSGSSSEGMNISSSLSRVLIGAVALIGVSLATATSPLPFPPFNLVVLWPALELAEFQSNSSIGMLAAQIAPFVITPALFLVWVGLFLRGRSEVSTVSKAAFLALFAVSAVWSMVGWASTVEFYGVSRALGLVVQCLLPPILLAAAFVASPPSTRNSTLAYHWLAFAWLSWSALPWYGELI